MSAGSEGPNRESYPLIFAQSIKVLSASIALLSDLADKIEAKPVVPNPVEKSPSGLQCPSLAEIMSSYPQKIKGLSEEIVKETSRIQGLLF